MSSKVIEEVTPFVKLLVAVLILTQEDLSPFLRIFLVIFDIFISFQSGN